LAIKTVDTKPSA